MTISMRSAACGLVAVAVSASAAACGAASSQSGGDDTTIKVAIITPASGALAQFGTDAVRGWKIAVDTVNAAGGVDGHKVELVVKNTDGDPATTLRAAREAVTQNGAKFIGGVVTSPENAALNAQLPGLGALAFNSTGQDDALAGEQCSPDSFLISQTTSMNIAALASSIAKMPGEKWAIQAVDYATGHTAAKVFTAAAEAAGKKVVLEQYAPLNTTDFGSYITKIKDSGADALFAPEYGSDGVAFIQQADQFKLNAQLKTTLGLNMVSEPLFGTLGDAIVGYYNNVGYDVNGGNELNKAFVEAYTKAYGTKPYYVPADNYLAAETLFAGIEKARSTDPSKVADALDDLTFDSIDGKVTMRAADHQLLRDDYLGKVVKDGDGLAFDLLNTATPEQTTPKANPACKM